MTEEDA